jgi:hypothetical protein
MCLSGAKTLTLPLPPGKGEVLSMKNRQVLGDGFLNALGFGA